MLVPYGLGAIAAGRALATTDGWLAAALVFLFLARIVLKDYRDRAGDAAYGKPTLLLRFGSTATCVVSFAALVLGAVLLPIALRPTLLVGTALLSLLVGAAVLLWRLRVATDDRAEQVAIGLGARLGNGVLLVALAWLVMRGAGASEEARTAFASLLALSDRRERRVPGGPSRPGHHRLQGVRIRRARFSGSRSLLRLPPAKQERHRPSPRRPSAARGSTESDPTRECRRCMQWRFNE